MDLPEERARANIDRLLTAAGWQVQDRSRANLGAAVGIAVREFPLATGEADYLLFVHRKAIGAVEAKPEGATLSGVEAQSGKYSVGLPAQVPAWHRPLPFLYESTGVETFFTNSLDPRPRSRRVLAFHRPETLAEWAGDGRGEVASPAGQGGETPPLRTLRARLQQMPPLITTGLWDAQIEAITNLETSLADDRPRALIQMATGSGKTFTAVSSIYRLIKFGGARRVLFLVDRSNLGRQTLKEFQQYVTPDDGRKFTELYNVQRLTLAGRLARLERVLTEADRTEIGALTGGRTLRDLANALLDAVDPDCRGEVASPGGGDQGGDQGGETPPLREWIERATAPFDDPRLRSTVIAIHRRAEQVINRVSIDRVTESAYSAEDTERARATVESFRQFIEAHRDEITALQMIYGRPYTQRRLTYEQVKELADRLATTQPNWTTESLWWAYVQLEKDKVSGAATQRVLTDLVSLVRHAVQLDDELVPYPRLVKQRYESWLADQEAGGRKFTSIQRWWLDRIAEHIGVNLAMTADDFDIGEFFDRGGQIAARKQFGRALPALLDELNTALVA